MVFSFSTVEQEGITFSITPSFSFANLFNTEDRERQEYVYQAGVQVRIDEDAFLVTSLR